MKTARTAAYNTLGELSKKVIKREDDASLWPDCSNEEAKFRIIHTPTTTIIISEGLSNTPHIPMEFYVEINGVFSPKELKHHFLVSFLERTIERALQESNLEEKLNDKGMHSFTLQLSFFSGINNYFVKEQEENIIGALIGITSPTVPKTLKINDTNVQLINARPYSNTWVNRLLYEIDEGESITLLFPQMLAQLKLAYGNYFSPFKNYSDDGKGIKVSAKKQKKINKKLANLYDNGVHEKTLIYIDKMLKEDIKYYNLLFTKAQTLSFLGRREESVEVYRKVIADYPKESKPYLNIATQLSILKQYDEAIEIYDFVINKFGGDDVDKAYYDRGIIYATLHNFQQAIDDLILSPYSFANRQVAKFYICDNDPKGAISFMKYAIDREYENDRAVFYFYFMICYLLTEENEKAEIAHQNYIRTKKLNTKKHERLDEIIFHLNQGDEFKAMLEEKGGPFFIYDKPDWAN